MTKESFLLFTEQIELLEQLTDEQAGKLIKSIYHYAQSGEEENLDPISRVVFISIRQDLDRNAQKYEEKRQKMSENGRKGGATHVTKLSVGNSKTTDLNSLLQANLEDGLQEGRKMTEEGIGQALHDNTSDLTNNLYGNKLPTACILSSEGEGNNHFIPKNLENIIKNGAEILRLKPQDDERRTEYRYGEGEQLFTPEAIRRNVSAKDIRDCHDTQTDIVSRNDDDTSTHDSQFTTHENTIHNSPLTSHISPLTNKKDVTDEERETFTNSYDEGNLSKPYYKEMNTKNDLIRICEKTSQYNADEKSDNIGYFTRRYMQLKMRENSS